jgi:RES domain-containing protein
VGRRPRRSRNSYTKRPSGEGDLPSLVLLEQFSQRSLQQWLASARKLNELQSVLFFGLELARQQFSKELIEAIRTNLVPGQPFDGWARIVDYRYCLAPLSVAGSLKGNGGRFNIGGSLNPAVFPPFPALYIAEDYPTAFRERFGSKADAGPHGLTGAELALRAPASFTHVVLRGQLELVIDISELRSLQPFATVLRKFSLPDHIRRLSRQLGMRSPPFLVRSAGALQRQLLVPDWRALPAQFDLPSNSQVFGRIAAAAGAHGILYPSARHAGKQCLAMFPQNWKCSASYVEVRDGAPTGARLTRIDAGTTSLH